LEVPNLPLALVARESLISSDYCVGPGEHAPFGGILLDDGYTERNNRCQYVRYDELRHRKSVAVCSFQNID